jgi:hypothetical protein
MSSYSSVKWCGSILGALVLGVGTVRAQIGSGQVSVMLSGGVEATVFASVPEGFEPDTATDQELRDYGYPPRPDAGETTALAAWQRAVHTTRVPTDLVERPGVFHGPVQHSALQQPTPTVEYGTDGNWSGVILDAKNAGFDAIVGTWAVPNVASQVKGTANAYSSMWVGLDGYGIKDLIQDGTESDWVNGKPLYDAWVEVLPSAEVVVKGLPVTPGDAIYASTQYAVVDGTAYAYFYMSNANTNQNVSVRIAFPTNLTFTGQSAEWVVERTQVDGTFEHPMPRYGEAFMSTAYAYRTATGTSVLYPANDTSSKVATTIYDTIKDSVSKKELSEPYPQGTDTILYDWLAY